MKQKVTFVLVSLILAMMMGVAQAAPLGQSSEGQEYVVKAGDWLSKIAQTYLGDVQAWQKIVEATNTKAGSDSTFTKITDPNRIEVGQKLWIPTTAALGGGGSTSTVTSTTTTTATVAAGTVLKVRLMETTDIHVHVMNYDYFRDAPNDTVGLAKTATLIKQARAEVKNSLLVDNGDLIQGNPMGDYMAKSHGLNEGDVHPVYKAMNLLDYEVGNIGNHEFNYGLDFLNKALAGSKFPYVCANVNRADTGAPYFTPYIIKEKTFVDEAGNNVTLKVGFIGFVPPQIMQWDKANLEGKVKAIDIVEAAKLYVPKMKAEGADLVVAIPHSGLDTKTATGMDENASYYLSTVPGIDAIMFGHAHRVFPGPDYKDLSGVDIAKGTINGVAAVMPGFWANNLGVVDLTLTQVDGKWKVTDSLSAARPISKRENNQVVSLVETDQAIVDAVKAEHDGTLEWIRKPIGESTAPIYSYFALVQDDPSIQIVTDAQTWYVQKFVQGTEYDGLPILSAGAPFKGGRGGPEDYTYVPAGTLAFKNAADLYLFPNTLKAVLLTGAQVREWLERSAGQFNQIDPNSTAEQELVNKDFPTYNFDVIDGVTYEIDVTQPSKYDVAGAVANASANRIKNLMYQGKPIADDQKFIVVTNNYRATGGGNFPDIKADKIIIDSPDENRQILANFISEKGSVNPSADNNWKFAPVNATVKVVFHTSASPEAAGFAAGFANVKATGQTTPEGFATYQLDMSK